VLVRPLAVLTSFALTFSLTNPIAAADPNTDAVSPDVPTAAAPPPVAVPADDGRVESSPPKTTNSPDGWTLTVSARDETQRVIAPLTTAISTREYEVGGIYSGLLIGPEQGDEGAQGTLEVGYQIGCGIDMSTSNGVSLTGTMGPTSSRRCRRGSSQGSAITSAAVSPSGSSPGSSTPFRCRRKSSRATSPGSWLTDSVSRSTAAWVSRSSARMHS